MITRAVLVKEVKKVSSMAVTIAAMALLQYLLQVVSLMMAGHLGELALSGVAMATSFCNVSGFSLLLGFASGLETLCGQAYGAQQYQKVGSYTYCAIISILPICFPMCLVWIFMDKLLVLIGQDPRIAMEACRYARWLIPALFAYAILQSQVRFFLAQSLILPVVFITLVTLGFHVPICWVLVFKSGLGNCGAALAIGLSYWLNVILLGIYMRYSSSCEKTRILVPEDVFACIKELFRFGIPSALMLCLEWWSFEILILLSGNLPNSKLETSIISICFTTVTVHFYIPLGISAAASTRVSNELGAGNPQAAQLASLVIMALTVAESVVASTIIFCCRYVFGYAFSNEKEVIDGVIKMVPLMCLSIIVNSCHAVLGGVVRGIGWQHIGAYINAGAYYLAGIPTGILCAFVFKLRGKGLWIGMLTGSTVDGILFTFVAVFTDWKKQAMMARERIFEGTRSS
ncbi:protein DETOXIFICATION 3-like [Hibiscus syriacus]|uniref:protein DETOXIFICATION 3-like n=1 Tax=Hibiscus syriacus TaxID=106335 RepID=UPI001921412A|nr:protein DETOXIFICATION 3-like [Hibiscus syriacus]